MNSIEIQREIEKITKRMLRSQGKYYEKIDKLKAICPHDTMEPKEVYYEGGYLNTDYTKHWEECVGCGLKSAERTVNHGNYA